ncbi:HlyD family secretion protein [Dichotomicrobium thermohalophilum]|uniref:Multidrug resistance efflux pump n=1 Tax=Dichotomicrobium thermohalophilum TaxID=933063 RepID=A0A397QA43_9HYPH|nr:HlyD family secretion protein [Dichotomicrobium thermohalophilum]RIA54984.1 multidrug resistance efflux pump [Dichotomicrobium thermohalophilum]
MLRVALGILALVAGLYIVVGEHLAGVSANATVNARLTTIRAPIDGTVTFAFDQIGRVIRRRQRLGDIKNDRVDNSRLSDLSNRRARLAAEIRKVKAQQRDTKAARKALDTQVASYKRGRIDQLRARIEEARARIEAAEAREREALQAHKRAQKLRSRGVMSAANLEEAKSNYEVAVKDTEAVRQKKAFLQVELSAARQGTFLGDSYNDAPYSQQRIKELELRLKRLDAELESLREQKKQLETQLDVERVRLARLSRAELVSPVNGVVWDFLANSGETVRKGQDLLRVVDCDTVMVTAGVSERLYNGLKRGDAAQFRLRGGERSYQATVTRLAGSGAGGRYDKLAIAPGPEQLERYDVLLKVPDLNFKRDTGCMVGRTGRVVFAHSPLNAADSLLMRLGL